MPASPRHGVDLSADVALYLTADEGDRVGELLALNNDARLFVDATNASLVGIQERIGACWTGST